MKPNTLSYAGQLLLILFCLYARTIPAQNICNANGNLMIFTNYDGGVLNINVDQNIPNLVIGVVAYEATSINLSGAFVANVTAVHYAGFNGSNNPCGGVLNTSINGAPGGAVTNTVFAPAAAFVNPNGYNMIICGYSCSNSTNQGGCNTVDQIEAYFASYFPGSTLFAHKVQYNCWTGTTYSISSGGSCCPNAALTPGAIAGSQSVCANEPLTPLTSATVASGGSGTIIYQWQSSTTSGSAGFTNILSTNSPNYNPPSVNVTTWYRRGSGTSNNPFVYSNTVAVTVKPAPVIVLPTLMNVVCEGKTLSFSASASLAASYSWTGPGGYTGSAQNFSLVAPLSASGMWYVTVLGTNNCTATAGMQVYVPPSPVLSTSNATACAGQPATLTVSGAIGGSYLWMGPSGYTANTASATVVGSNNTVTASYTVIGTGIGSCTSIATATVDVLALPQVSLNANKLTICAGESATLTASGAATYSWISPNLPQTATVTVSPAATTAYTIQTTNASGCSNRATASVSVDACTAIAARVLTESSFLVYPNPNKGSFIIQSSIDSDFELVNAQGEFVRIIRLARENNYRVSLTGIADGIYYLVPKDKNAQGKKIIVGGF